MKETPHKIYAVWSQDHFYIFEADNDWHACSEASEFIRRNLILEADIVREETGLTSAEWQTIARHVFNHNNACVW